MERRFLERGRQRQDASGTGPGPGRNPLRAAGRQTFKNELMIFGCADHCCAWVFSSCSKQRLLFVEERGLLTVVASLVAEHELWVT